MLVCLLCILQSDKWYVLETKGGGRNGTREACVILSAFYGGCLERASRSAEFLWGTLANRPLCSLAVVLELSINVSSPSPTPAEERSRCFIE